MQTPAQNPGQAPPPTTPPAPTVVLPGSPAQTLPLTAGQVAAIRAQRAELSDQLNSANGRRATVARQLLSATGANKVGLEQRLAVLDQRIAQLETDIATTGKLLTSSPGSLVGSTSDPPWLAAVERNIGPLASLFMVFVLAPVAIGFARRLWRHPVTPPLPATSPDTTQRLERIEQTVDSIAVEVERVSENQRFLTRVLTEGPDAAARRSADAGRADGAPLALGPGSAPFEPVRVEQRESVPLSRPAR